jgi:hypothetical protein
MPRSTVGNYSCGAQMSAMVPPTMVLPVEPNAPDRKRATITVCTFLDLYNSTVNQDMHYHKENENAQSNHKMHKSK